MTKYIEADALKRKFIFTEDGRRIPVVDADNFPVQVPIAEILKIIHEMPATDVKQVRRWIDVEENLPEYGKKVLAYWERFSRKTNEIYCFIDILYRTSERGWFCDGCGEPNGKVIAWQPLPELPKMNGGCQK